MVASQKTISREQTINNFIDPATGKVFANLAYKRTCPVCQSKECKFIFNKEGFDHVKCEECSMLYTPFVLKDEVIKDFYDSNYFNNAFNSKSEDKTYLSTKEEYFEKMAKIIEKYKNTGSMIDIGCGLGMFLKVMSLKGWNAEGTEYNKYNRDWIKKEFNLNVHNKNLSDFKSESYDLISMCYLLEHIPHPNKLIVESHRVLKKDGLLFLSIPNEFGISSIVRGAEAPRFKGAEHFNFFSIKTISKLLQLYGFEILHASTTELDVHGIFKHFFRTKKPELNFTSTTKNNQTITNNEAFAINKIIKKPFSIIFYKIIKPICQNVVGYLGFGEDILILARKV